MKLDTQKRLAASILKCSSKRIRFDDEDLEAISEAITKADIKGLISGGSIVKLPARGVSRVRANKRLIQKRKGRRSGAGKNKGTHNARADHKGTWMNRVRAQRKYLYELRDKKEIDPKTFRDLYKKSKGGFFRSKRHINLYINENNLRLANGKTQ